MTCVILFSAIGKHSRLAGTLTRPPPKPSYSHHSLDSMAAVEFGPVWKRKIRTMQTRLDLDKDGFVTIGDFDILLERFASIGQASPKQREKLQTTVSKFVNEFLAEPAASGPLGVDAYVAAIEAQGKKKYSKAVFAIYASLFDGFDTNNVGFISPEQYQIYYKMFEMDPSWAEDSFKAVDKNKDGEISKAEYLAAVDDFFCSENPSNFMGPAVD